jgi:hypothetical protein
MPLDLDAIQARYDAATPGPWRWGGYLRGPIFLLSMAQWRPYVMQFCRLGMQGAQPIFRKPNPNLGFSEWAKATDVAVREVPYRDDIIAMNNPDAEFIAHARTDVPALAAELRSTRVERDENLANVRRIDDLRIADTARLQRELDAALVARDELAFAVRDLLDWAKRRHSGDLSLRSEEYYRTTEHAQRVLQDHAPEEAR